MTNNPGRTPLLLAVLAGLGAPVFAPAAHAWPTTSPSAKSAARLKYHPPDNWLQHYLPDDRYKIAGGVWKVVSTQYDTYYHRPDSQYMLRQPAGIVIGFASEQEAKEAGYRSAGGFMPSGSAGKGAPAAVQAKDSVTVSVGRRRITVRGNYIKLADGSSAMLPAGWTLSPGKLEEIMGMSMSVGLMKAPSGQFIALTYAKSPGKDLSEKPGTDDEGTTISTTLGGLQGSTQFRPNKVPTVMIKGWKGDQLYTIVMRRSIYDSAIGKAVLKSFRPQ